jgi:hypothetical protein
VFLLLEKANVPGSSFTLQKQPLNTHIIANHVQKQVNSDQTTSSPANSLDFRLSTFLQTI